MSKYSLPKPLNDLIEQFERLPGVGPKSAARLAYHVIRAPREVAEKLAEHALSVKDDLVYCKKCFNLSEDDICSICKSAKRDSSMVCVVEEPLDLAVIENSGEFNGLYHVLGGVISPVEGIGPDQLRVKELLSRVNDDEDIKEVIIATNPTLNGDATALYLSRNLVATREGIIVSRLARGLPTGADIEYADSFTIKKSFQGRGAV